MQYRKVQPEEGRVVTQLVIPQKIRGTIIKQMHDSRHNSHQVAKGRSEPLLFVIGLQTLPVGSRVKEFTRLIKELFYTLLAWPETEARRKAVNALLAAQESQRQHHNKKRKVDPFVVQPLPCIVLSNHLATCEVTLLE